ncbi:hypothetical protein [Actinoplanes sp. NPDC049599]|uniref:hypothetical protein n=1 Tax=Actinoplanes sp. NPDC049599 TaxID=3363903 RepID=UPI0037A402B6
MRSLGTRRAALGLGAAALATVALAGCSAGQVAETALKNPSVYGVNSDSSDSSVFIRNLAVAYPGTAGYPAGADAPLQVGLYNQTRQAITVLVSSRPATDVAGVVSAQAVGLSGGAAASSAPSATPEPSGSSTPSAEPSAPGAATRPARIEIAPLGSVTFLPEDAEKLVATGLSGKLVPGQSLNLVFEFSNGAEPLVLRAPMAVPLSPASRAPGIEPEGEEE